MLFRSLVLGLLRALSAALALLLFPGGALAFQMLADQTVSVASGTTIGEDLYVFAEVATIEGTVQGDLIVFAQSVRVTGLVTGDLATAAADVQVSGQVRGSIRAAGGQVTLASNVGEDVLAAGGEVLWAQTARSGRDAALAGGSVTIAGAVGRNLKAASGELWLYGKVGSTASLQADKLIVGPQASVGGDLAWAARTSSQISPQAKVGGQVIQRPAPRPERWRSGAMFALLWTRTLVGFFLLGLILTLGLPRLSVRAARALRFAPGQALAFGLAVCLLTPLVAVTVFAFGLLVGGWWIGLMLLCAFAILLCFAFSASGLAVGRLLLRGRSERRGGLTLELLVGLIVLLLVGLIPFLGAAVVLLALVFGLGALLRAGFTREAPLPA